VITQRGNSNSDLSRRFQNGGAGIDGDILVVDGDNDRFVAMLHAGQAHRLGSLTERGAGMVVLQGFHGWTLPMISSLKLSTIERKALGLDCPSPHLEAS